MKWQSTFEARLSSWTQLREQATALPLEPALELINAWWFFSPWNGYYLHWDDCEEWPDPWQLLDDNMFCEVARGLGILYTIAMIDRADVDSVELVLTDAGHNVVLVNKSKYILNWDKSTVVNTNPELKAVKQITQLQVKNKYK